MAKGNRALAQKMAKHVQQRRRGYTMPSGKAEARETCARIALFAAHF